MFILLAVAGVALAWFKPRKYAFVPWVSLAVTIVILFISYGEIKSINLTVYLLLLTGFAALYAGAGYLLMWRAKIALLWGGLLAATALTFFGLTYLTLSRDFAGVPLFWGIIALSISGLMMMVMQQVMQRKPENQPLLAVFAATASAFFSVALFIELDKEFLPAALALQIMAMAWLNTRLNVMALRPLTIVLFGVFAIALFPQITEKTFYTVATALFSLGLPASFFLVAAKYLKQQRDDRFVYIIEMTAAFMLALSGYLLLRQVYHDPNYYGVYGIRFLERGILANFLYILGFSYVVCSQKYQRQAFLHSGIILFTMALLRTIFLDVAFYNPVANNQTVHGVFLFNSMLINYGLPAIWLSIAAKKLAVSERIRSNPLVHIRNLQTYFTVMALFLIFVLVSLNIRFLFAGQNMHTAAYSDLEIYAYSIVWLLLGVGLLFVGTLKNVKILRSASLVVMIITVGKVFLYDTSELEGLYRVFSFLGLGVSLLGLSWFYSKFVFQDDPQLQHRQ